MGQPYLMKFFGREDPHSMEMTTTVSEVEKSLGLNIQRLEIWHNHQNQKLFAKYLRKLNALAGKQLPVPAFFNKKTGKILFGPQDFSSLSSWATGK